MYLVCCPNIYAQQMVDSLAELNIEGMPLNLMELNFDKEKREFIKSNINEFDYVYISSPAAIDFLEPVIKENSEATFITVGEMSALKIKRYNPNVEVIYPEESSGKEALFQEKVRHMNLRYKKILAVVNNDSSSIPPNFTSENTTLAVMYKRKLNKPDANELKKLLDSRKLRGIIVTSTVIAEWLFQIAFDNGYMNKLKDKLFIVLHPQIETILMKLGAGKILVTESADRDSVVKLVRSLYD